LFVVVHEPRLAITAEQIDPLGLYNEGIYALNSLDTRHDHDRHQGRRLKMAGAAFDPIHIPDRVWHQNAQALQARDVGALFHLAKKYAGATQTRISALTGISQGRVNTLMNRKGSPIEVLHVFERVADGLNMPDHARILFGIAPRQPIATITGIEVDAALGLDYPDTVETGIDNVTDLWRADLDDAPQVTRAPVDPGLWGGVSVRWLVSPDVRNDAVTNGPKVGALDVLRFRATVDHFAQLDNRFGGGHARHGLIHYLATDGEHLLRGRFADDVGKLLYSAVAEATLLAAWMSYDSTPTGGLAQRYFVQALALAQAGGDRLLGASVLDAMSHQATFVGRFRDAANLAGAARTGTQGHATPTLAAHFYAMEARALARLGDAKACDAALAKAVEVFERRRPEDDPEWIRYFDDAELAAEIGHCFRDLGRPMDATTYARQCLGSIDDTTFLRSDFFATMVLADAHLGAGEADQACTVALGALKLGEQLRSARCISYLREFRERLTTIGPFKGSSTFEDQARESRLWRIAARPA
jgi:hypothetical protein